MTEPPLLYLNSLQVQGILASINPVDVAKATLHEFARGRSGLGPESAMRWTAPDETQARNLYLPAWSGSSYGAKIINACIGNPDRGLPRASGLIILFDHLTAMPIAVLEGARISATRTAAVSVAAVSGVTPLETITTLGLLGTGTIARTHLDLMLRYANKLERVQVFDVRTDRATSLCDAYADQVHITAVPAPRDALLGAEVSIAATTATTSYVEEQWLESAIFVNVSLADATEGLLVNCDYLLVDDWDLIVTDDQRLLGQLAREEKVCGPDSPAGTPGRIVNATLDQLLTNGYPRNWADNRDRVVVNPFGMGVQDIALATEIVNIAQQAGLGTELAR